MAAVLRESSPASLGERGFSSGMPRHSGDLVDRRAIVDVSAVMDGKSVQGSDEEIWMLSYMDIMTLMLALFVLLLAYSKIAPQSVQDVPTVQAVKPMPAVKTASVKTVPAAAPQAKPRSAAVSAAVAAKPQPAAAPAPKSSPTEISSLALALAFGVMAPVDAITPPLLAATQHVVHLRQAPAAAIDTAPDALAAREQLIESMRAGALGQRIELSADQDSVNLDISDNILFDPSSATLKPDGLQLLDELAQLLVAQQFTVSIEGHSDNVPFSNAQFASNWELSATRATNVTRHLIARGVAAPRLRAIGYADTRPRADNATSEGKARNRRVALVLHLPAQAAATAITAASIDR